MLPWLHANKTYLKRPWNNGRGWKSEHGQTMTDGEHLIQLQQVGAQCGTVWSDGPHSSEDGLSWNNLCTPPDTMLETPDQDIPDSTSKKQVQAISATLCFDVRSHTQVIKSENE